MARTYRRKGITQDYYWVLWHWGTPYYLNRSSYERDSKEGKKAIAIYHSDATITMEGSAPRSYCKVRWHKMRQDAKKQLHMFWKDEEHEVQIHANHKHSANWDYW